MYFLDKLRRYKDARRNKFAQEFLHVITFLSKYFIVWANGKTFYKILFTWNCLNTIFILFLLTFKCRFNVSHDTARVILRYLTETKQFSVTWTKLIKAIMWHIYTLISLVITDSSNGNGLYATHQAIILTNVNLLSVEPLGINVSD